MISFYWLTICIVRLLYFITISVHKVEVVSWLVLNSLRFYLQASCDIDKGTCLILTCSLTDKAGRGSSNVRGTTSQVEGWCTHPRASHVPLGNASISCDTRIQVGHGHRSEREISKNVCNTENVDQLIFSPLSCFWLQPLSNIWVRVLVKYRTQHGQQIVWYAIH